jgi:hypothetical protein
MSVLEKALRLELLGMKSRGRSAYSIIKSEFGLKGNKQSVYDQFRETVYREKAIAARDRSTGQDSIDNFETTYPEAIQ